MFCWLLHEWEWKTFSFCTIIVTYVHSYKVMNEHIRWFSSFEFYFIFRNSSKFILRDFCTIRLSLVALVEGFQTKTTNKIFGKKIVF